MVFDMYRQILVTVHTGLNSFPKDSIHDALIDSNNSAVVVGKDSEIKVLDKGSFIMLPPAKTDSLMMLKPKQIILVFE